MFGLSPNLNRYFGEGNFANYNNEEAKKILNELYSIKDEKILKEKYTLLQNMYQTDRAYIGLYFNKSTLIYGKDMGGNISIKKDKYSLYNYKLKKN